MKKALNLIKNIFVWLMVALAVCMMIFTVVSVNTFDRTDRSLFGFKAFIVLSDSMSKTDFDAGDLVLVKEVDPSTLKEGDIIAYTSQNTSNYGETVTHKIRKLTTDANGELGFITYGTTTDTDDETVVTYTYVLGKYTSHIPKVGQFFMFLKTTPGYIVCILIPFLILILIDDQYDADAPLQVNAIGVGDILVTNESTQNSAEVSEAKTISSGDMTVTYPAGVKLNNTGAVTGDTDKKTTVEQKFEYVGDTPSASMTGISIDNGKAVASYELTLPVSTSNDTPVTITINYPAGLTGVQVYHSGTLLTSTANTNGESAVYDPNTGVLTLTLNHASPIDVVYNVYKSTLPENANLVYTLDELEAAVENLHNGDYIAFGANIVQDKVDTTSGQITFKRATDTEGDIEATLDLNGYVFDGQIGGFSFANDGITVKVIGTEKAVAEYYKHETGNHMVKACAVFNYSGNTVLEDGLFESNNIVVMAYGGKVVVNGGDIHNTEDGVAIYACNDPEITINGGNFSCEEDGAIFVIEPYRTNKGPVITINDGVFDASKAACFLCVDGRASDAGEVAQVVINGGTFTMPSDPDWAQDGDGVLANGSNRLVIRGGTFNIDPSAYVDTNNYNVTQNASTWTVTAK